MSKLFKQFIEQAVSQEIDRRLADVKKVQPKEGYNPLEAIREGLFHWVLVPFNGIPVWCRLRCMNQTQLEACGAFTLVSSVEKLKCKAPELKDILEIRNRQEEIAKNVLVIPTFDEIMKLVTGEDLVIQRAKEELETMKAVDEKSLPTDKRKEFRESIEKLEISIAFLLPEDTMGFLTSWAVGADVTDIKKLTADQLFNAAVLAEKGHDNPTDHISGCFTDRDKGDIDAAAWAELAKRKEDAKRDNEGGKRWIGGGGK